MQSFYSQSQEQGQQDEVIKLRSLSASLFAVKQFSLELNSLQCWATFGDDRDYRTRV